MNKTLKIRFFGSGLILHTASFSLEWWELLLKKNRLKEEVFFDHLFTDDLFLQKSSEQCEQSNKIKYYNKTHKR